MILRTSSSGASTKPLCGHSVASRVAREFGHLYRNGRGSVGAIIEPELVAVDGFMEANREAIIRNLLPNLWECERGGYGVCIVGGDGSGTLPFSEDFSSWSLTGAPFDAAGHGVASLMSFIAYGRRIGRLELAQLLGVAAAKSLLSREKRA